MENQIELLKSIEAALLAVPSDQAAFSVTIYDDLISYRHHGAIRVIMNAEDSEEVPITVLIQALYQFRLINAMTHTPYKLSVVEDEGCTVIDLWFLK